MSNDATPSATVQKRPPNWDKVVAYAYLRMDGKTQEESARCVGRSRRAVQLWEANAELWRAARAEARERWFAETEDDARRAVRKKIAEGDADLGMRFLERVDERLAPPKQRVEASTYDFDPDDFSPDGLRRIAAGEDPKRVLASGGRAVDLSPGGARG